MPGLGSTLWNGVSGLRSFSTAMTVVSDNIANAGTTGFKANEIRFADLVSSNYSTLSSYTDREGSGSRTLAILTDFAQGPIINTSNWSDVAINGEGFFKVVDENGKEYFTRDGTFHLDKDGFLVNALGYKVQGEGGDIQFQNVENYVSFTIGPDGTIYAIDRDGNTNTEKKIVLFRFQDPNGLRRVGNNLWEYTPLAGSGADNALTPGQDGAGTLVGFAIEGSNVDLSEELVNMIIYQANFNANSKVITTAADMLNTTVNMVR